VNEEQDIGGEGPPRNAVSSRGRSARITCGERAEE